MTGSAFLRKFRAIEEQAGSLGFKITAPKHFFDRGHDVVALCPKDADSLPIYSRDAELFVGSIEDLEVWLRGLEWARQYDRMLFGKKHEAARTKREGVERTRQLFNALRDQDSPLLDK